MRDITVLHSALVCVGLTILPPLCADCHEIWEPQPLETSGPVQACKGIALPITLHYHYIIYLCPILAYDSVSETLHNLSIFLRAAWVPLA